MLSAVLKGAVASIHFEDQRHEQDLLSNTVIRIEEPARIAFATNI